LFGEGADGGKLFLQILQIMKFGVFADLDEAGVWREKIGIDEISEFAFVLQGGIAQELSLCLVYPFS
jgi:hypothetical protein